MNGSSKMIKLGYYNHGQFITDKEGQTYVSFDVSLWADRFSDICTQFTLFLNKDARTIQSEKDIPKSYYKLNPRVNIVDIGDQKSHWQRMFGIGINKQDILRATADLDWIIIQGPTPQQNVIAGYVHPSCKIAVLLVGIWIKWPKAMFRRRGIKFKIRELFINALKFYNKRQTINLVNTYATRFLGNNPEMPNFYTTDKEFTLVSKGLIKENEIIQRTSSFKKLNTIRLIAYSRIDPEKNIELLIQAVHQLIQQGRDVHLEVHGGGSVKEYLNYLTQLIESLGLRHQVYLKGEISNSDKIKIFENSDIYIFNTCTTEGFPRTIWEAMASGIPVISAAYMGARSFFQLNEVELFEQNNLDDLVQKIIKLADNPDLRENLVAKSYALLKENTLEKSTIKLLDLFSEKVK